MNGKDILILTMAACIFWSIREILIAKFKIGYYEQKLENRKVDISKVKNIGLIGIFKL